MAKSEFFLIYKDDEGHINLKRHSVEASMLKEIVKHYEDSKQVPILVIRGQVLKVSISTKVLFEMQESG